MLLLHKDAVLLPLDSQGRFEVLYITAFSPAESGLVLFLHVIRRAYRAIQNLDDPHLSFELTQRSLYPVDMLEEDSCM